MEETKLQRTNNFKVVGRLIKADIRNGVSARTGQAYISATATVKSVVEGNDCEYEVSFFANQNTAQGKPSALYTSYSKMGELEGKKVEITGELRENRYFSTRAEQMVSSQQLSGRFIRGVSDTTPDEGRWEMSGFVAQILNEKKNRNNEIYRYDIMLGQANRSGNALSMFTLHVDPKRRDILAGVNGYEVGQTVSLYGILDFKVETVTSEAKNEGGFGEPVIRTYTNRQKNFFITGGSAPIKDESKYEGSMITDLIAGYKAHDQEILEKSKSNTPTAAVETAPKITKKQVSLI